MRKLVTIRKVSSIDPIEGADFIEKATVDGWQCVVKKGEFAIGDLAVYFEVDSFLPIQDRYEFLRKSSYRNPKVGEEGFRLRTVKLRKTLSQGLLMPIDEFPELTSAMEGNNGLTDGTDIMDITDILGVKKWDPPLPAFLAGKAKGYLPEFVPKTDEERIQNMMDLFSTHKNVHYEATEKIDGTSMSVYYNPAAEVSFGVCSRRLELERNEESAYWKLALEIGLENTLTAYQRPLVLQGEMAGPGIQKNPLKLEKITFFVFNIVDILKGTYLGPLTRRFVFRDLKELSPLLEHTPIIEYAEDFQPFETYPTLKELLKASERPSLLNPNVPLEGIVYKGVDPDYCAFNQVSFKVLNNQLLIDEEG